MTGLYRRMVNNYHTKPRVDTERAAKVQLKLIICLPQLVTDDIKHGGKGSSSFVSSRLKLQLPLTS